MPDLATSVDRLMRPREAAEYLGLHVNFLANLRAKHLGPRYIKLGARAVRYYLSDCDAWAMSHAVETEPRR